MSDEVLCFSRTCAERDTHEALGQLLGVDLINVDYACISIERAQVSRVGHFSVDYIT